jgi:hypothetical protein
MIQFRVVYILNEAHSPYFSGFLTREMKSGWQEVTMSRWPLSYPEFPVSSADAWLIGNPVDFCCF